MLLLSNRVAPVRCSFQSAAQRPLGVSAAQQLPHLLADGADLRLGDGRKGRVQGRDIEILRGFGVEGVNVDCAPVVGEGGRGDLLDNGHGGGGGGGVGKVVVVCCVAVAVEGEGEGRSQRR